MNCSEFPSWCILFFGVDEPDTDVLPQPLHSRRPDKGDMILPHLDCLTTYALQMMPRREENKEFSLFKSIVAQFVHRGVTFNTPSWIERTASVRVQQWRMRPSITHEQMRNTAKRREYL
ncbi:hypothetical protein FALCPG4_003232 [Fusarium falciforme]